jgi:hypothetical protein
MPITSAQFYKPAAPCCDVTASQPTLPKPGLTARFHFFARTVDIDHGETSVSIARRLQ